MPDTKEWENKVRFLTKVIWFSAYKLRTYKVDRGLLISFEERRILFDDFETGDVE